MRVYLPFDATAPKTRLSSVFDAQERTALAEAMLQDVLAAVREAGHDPTVLATAPIECGAPVTVDDRPLSRAINGVLADADGPVAVLMADLPLVTADTVERLTATEGDVVLAPGLGGGTNALVVRTDDFEVDFHGASIEDHRAAAAAVGATVGTVDSFRLALDVDEPQDLAEVLLHGEGHAREWLDAAGMSVSITDGRVTAQRKGGNDRQRD